MSGQSTGASRPTLLLFADISGYTHYIRSNVYTDAHAVATVATLLDSVIDVLEPAWQLVKLEGDAAFCQADPDAVGTGLPELLRAAFAAFDRRKARLSAANTCDCLACKSIVSLDLKMILHAGDVVHHQTRRGRDLAGIAVILLHRLSKNTVNGPRYVLWTRAMADYLSAFAPAPAHVETCEGLGEVEVHVYAELPDTGEPVVAGSAERLLDHIHRSCQWLVPNLTRAPGKAAAFGELPPP